MTRNKNSYTLTGEIKKQEQDLSAWGFNPPTDYILPLFLTVEGADDSATVSLKGTHYDKKLTKANFDTADGIILVLNGTTTQYTIIAQASAEEEPVVLTIYNNATLEA